MRLLVCTDVAARGIDIHGVPYGKDIRFPHCITADPGNILTSRVVGLMKGQKTESFSVFLFASPLHAIISHNSHLYFLVINVTLPDEKQNYVHRIGRVGRAER